MKVLFFTSLLFLASCDSSKPTKQLDIAGSGQKTVIVLGSQDAEGIRKQAVKLGVEVIGEEFLILKGDTQQLNKLNIDDKAITALDQKLQIPEEPSFEIAEGALYMAKKDFGILEFAKLYPNADGRGVTVGVFDDGISPHQSGFKLTTTGERKLLKRGSPSTLTSVKLENNEGVLNEEIVGTAGSFDLNSDGKNSALKVKVQNNKICLDWNADETLTDDECKGSFGETGDYFISANGLDAVTAEFDSEKSIVKFSQPELDDDSHGEGVATVLAGHSADGRNLDGVAPGAKIVDWDLSENTASPGEGEYTMGNILLGLEWLAKNGAEVANISYSLFFASAESQDFMSKAIDQLVKKYNIVLSFSAGNNGPGLGSLNRKVIYPDSVLVAGAFVSKELDEAVWGVTGLPDEGRVVYYSSRGPGPLGDHGPTLISPLSSLTHVDPASGFGAFSGTSSASPALAGAATVLISALKAEGIKIDAPTIVQALRLSGQRLQGEPFVAQGYGLPKLPQAFEIYKKLVSGTQFMNVTIRTNRVGVDGIGSRGIFLLRSQSREIEGARISLTGIASAAAPSETPMNLLTPITIEYSKGIKGAETLWLSVSSSRFDIDVNIHDVLESSQGEGFGEIKIKDATDGTLLAIVPVTILDDLSPLQSHRQNLTVGSQGSARIHLNVQPGLQAVRIRTKVLEGESYGLLVSTFNSNRVRTQSVRLTDEIWMVVDQPGHYQIALSMNGGTGREAKVEFNLEPIKIEMKTSVAVQAKPILALKNHGTSSLYSTLEIRPKAEIVRRIASQIGVDFKPLEISLAVAEPTTLIAEAIPFENADSRFLYVSCSTTVTNAEGKVSFGEEAYKQTDAKENNVLFRCMPFDYDISAKLGVSYVMNIWKSKEIAQSKDFAMSPLASKDIALDPLETGTYEVSLKNSLGGQIIKLGDINIL